MRLPASDPRISNKHNQKNWKQSRRIQKINQVHLGDRDEVRGSEEKRGLKKQL